MDNMQFITAGNPWKFNSTLSRLRKLVQFTFSQYRRPRADPTILLFLSRSHQHGNLVPSVLAPASRLSSSRSLLSQYLSYPTIIFGIYRYIILRGFTMQFWWSESTIIAFFLSIYMNLLCLTCSACVMVSYRTKVSSYSKIYDTSVDIRSSTVELKSLVGHPRSHQRLSKQSQVNPTACEKYSSRRHLWPPNISEFHLWAKEWKGLHLWTSSGEDCDRLLKGAVPNCGAWSTDA